MNFKDRLAIFCGNTVSLISTTLHFGAGATWPGEIALSISPALLRSLSGMFSKGVILVVGTNGKTTTSSMISTILTKQGHSLVHNTSGANLLNGVVSSCVLHFGKTYEYGVFEVDENSLPHVMRYITPKIVVVLNLFRDQLDRYGEVDVIAQKWHAALKPLTSETTVILNADDPLVASFGKKLEARVLYFGLSEKFKQDRVIDHATDSIFCQYCGGRLAYSSYFFSHLGDWYCTVCGDKRPDVALSSWNSPLPGLYNTYNTLPAVLVGRELGIVDTQIESALVGFRPAFGRQEEFDVDGKKIKLFLSKNPAGFTASLRAVLDMNPKAMMIALNDRIPDGRDVSWIWDVDFEMIGKKTSVVVTGDRVYDIALRIQYAEEKNMTVESDLKKAINAGLLHVKHGETLYILATYSAMLDIRKILTGRKIL